MLSSIRKLQMVGCRQFARLQTSIPPVKKVREKEVKKKEAMTDDKFVKLSKKEDSSAKILKELQERNARIAGAKTHDLKIDQKVLPAVIKNYKIKLGTTKVDLVDDPLKSYNLLRESMQETLGLREEVYKDKEQKKKQVFDSLDARAYEGKSWKQIKKERVHFNAEAFVNEKFHIEPVANPAPMSRRSGVLGYKVGMTSVYDKWGHVIPLTVIQVDRCQVIRAKTKEADGYDALVVGCGERSLHRLRKSMMGIFLQANVPPKLDLVEFKISPENVLPVGFMLGVRHFNVGQFVDIKARTKGKGFSGPMKRWGFDGLPASHGCSLTHRSHGSTGQRQDPGRVFKNKKMAGRMGNTMATVRKLLVYKIDYERALIYVKGSVPGPMHRVVELSDAYFHWKQNIGKLNYPTFLYERGKVYANVMQAEPPEQDPTEDWLHENAIVSDDEEEGAGVTTGAT